MNRSQTAAAIHAATCLPQRRNRLDKPAGHLAPRIVAQTQRKIRLICWGCERRSVDLTTRVSPLLEPFLPEDRARNSSPVRFCPGGTHLKAVHWMLSSSDEFVWRVLPQKSELGPGWPAGCGGSSCHRRRRRGAGTGGQPVPAQNGRRAHLAAGPRYGVGSGQGISPERSGGPCPATPRAPVPAACRSRRPW